MSWLSPHTHTHTTSYLIIPYLLVEPICAEVGTCYNEVYAVRSLCTTYVYCTVQHLDSWIKRDQLDVTCFIISLCTAQHVSDVNTSILRSLRLIWWVISLVVIFLVHVCFSLHPDTTPPQPNHNVTPTHIEPEQHNPWNTSTNKSQAPEDGCINIRNMLSSK